MVFYDNDVKKRLGKGHPPKEIAELFNNAFQSLDLTKDLNLFDIKKLKTHDDVDYYRLRKGKYRAIFFIKEQDFYIIAISKREEVYKKWL